MPFKLEGAAALSLPIWNRVFCHTQEREGAATFSLLNAAQINHAVSPDNLRASHQAATCWKPTIHPVMEPWPELALKMNQRKAAYLSAVGERIGDWALVGSPDARMRSVMANTGGCDGMIGWEE